MSDLFGRHAIVEMGRAGQDGFSVDSVSDGVDLEGLRISFDVQKTIHSSANTATVKVYNLSAARRTEAIWLPDSGDGALRLRAGYGDETELIYEGDVNRAWVERSGGDVVANLECGDGLVAFAAQTINKTFPAGTEVTDVILAVAKKFTESIPDYKIEPVAFNRQPRKKKPSRLSVKGLERDLSRLKSTLSSQGFATRLRRPLSLTGNGREVLDELARMWRFLWSVQDGSIQVVAYGASTEESVLLTKDTGLLGLPEPTQFGIKVRSLIIPRVRPGGALTVRSETINGQFRVESVRISGDTRGGDWTTEAEARSL